MPRTISNNDVKRQNRIRIAKYILENGAVSRQELATALGFSLPTVFSNVTELMEEGFLYEAGEYGSTGGRKAKYLAIQRGFKTVIGLDITKRHLRILLMDISKDIIAEQYYRCNYSDTTEYYQGLENYVKEFINIYVDNRSALIGIGISIPGIISQHKGVLQRSHILDVRGVSLNRFCNNIPYNKIYDNDANCAAYAEVKGKYKNIAYFSLSNTVGGAIYHDGVLCPGDNFKSGEFGHMLIYPGGRPCYCGKQGCLDAYCSVPVLLDNSDDRLDDFFDGLTQGNEKYIQTWNTYLDSLAIAVTNIRMAFDCDIMLGGYIGGYIEQYIGDFYTKISKYNNFDQDMSYIKIGKYKRQSSAIGAAMMMIDQFVDTMD